MHAIGFVRHHFLPPSETFIYTSLRALVDYKVRVLALRRDQSAKFPFGDVTLLSDSSPLSAEALLYRAFAWSPRALRWARTVKLIHAHTGNAGVHAAVMAQKAQRPLVVSYYGKDVTAPRGRARWNPSYWHYVIWQKWLFSVASRILVLSDDMRRSLLAQGAPEHKLRTVPLGVDLSRFAVTRLPRPRTQPLRVLMVGREVEKKGFDDGLRACAAARAAGADLDLTILGTGGPLRGALQRLARELDLTVRWPAPETRVAQAMAEHDVLLVPSRTSASGDKEGTPTVICEGSAAQLAVVATRHAGIPEQVEHERTGLLVAERDVTDMAQQLSLLHQHRELAVVLGRAGARKMQAEYSVAAHAARLSTVYRELL